LVDIILLSIVFFKNFLEQFPISGCVPQKLAIAAGALSYNHFYFLSFALSG
jgi:hypothetical protein